MDFFIFRAHTLIICYPGRLSGFPAFRLSGFLASWLPGFPASWLSGFLAFRLPGFLAFWLSGFLAFWLSGFPGRWLIATKKINKIFLIFLQKSLQIKNKCLSLQCDNKNK